MERLVVIDAPSQVRGQAHDAIAGMMAADLAAAGVAPDDVAGRDGALRRAGYGEASIAVLGATAAALATGAAHA